MAKYKGKILGYAAVDSGQLLIVDPCYLSAWKDGEAFPKRGDKDYGNHYAKACKITTEAKDQGGELLVSGIAGNGVVFASGYGDGNYPITAEYDKNGKIESIVVHLQ